MKNIYRYLAIIILATFFSGCAEKWLDKPMSYTLVTPEKVWNDKGMITSLLSNYYNRLPAHTTIYSNWTNYAAYDEAISNGTADINLDNNNLSNYAYNRWTYWDYGLIRDINKAIGGLATYSTKLDEAYKAQITSEFRFLRAFVYFEMVKRMGGVPIVAEELIYDYSGDPSYLAKPRAKEEEVYDFIASECDAIKETVGNVGSKDRVNKYAVLALKCRAMLYAGSLAKYNNLMPSPITITDYPGVVGIPAARAAGYYQKSLDAAQEIIASGRYALYTDNPDPGQNFYEALTKKTNNREMIMVMDFNVARAKRHNFSYQNIVRTAREDNLSSSGLGPTLNLVEAFEYLDGSAGTLRGVGDGTDAGQSRWIFYDKPQDIFAGKDGRLFGTVVYPGTSFKGVDVNMQAGVYEWNGTKYVRYESSKFGDLHTDGKLLTGIGGPMRTTDEVSNTGFYLKKFIDPAALSSARGVGSDIAWPRFRYGEVLLNAAEAAFELGGANTADAVNYINQVRQRAGFPANSLNATTLTFDRIMNERRVELAFEDHRVWDLARWRRAHILWDSQSNNTNANMFALYPYRIVHPGSPRDGKYVYDKFKAPKFSRARYYRMGNYYSQISQTVLDNNKLIVKNPFH